jgi:hypothetical protein
MRDCLSASTVNHPATAVSDARAQRIS